MGIYFSVGGQGIRPTCRDTTVHHGPPTSARPILVGVKRYKIPDGASPASTGSAYTELRNCRLTGPPGSVLPQLSRAALIQVGPSPQLQAVQLQPRKRNRNAYALIS